GATPPAQLAARRGCPDRGRVRGDRESLHLHAHDRIGVTLVFRVLCAERSLLSSEELRWVCPVWPFEVARPEIVRLHHVKVAVQDEIAITRHIAPPPGRRLSPEAYSR